MKLNDDNFLYPALGAPPKAHSLDNLFPWDVIWKNPGQVSPDHLTLRGKSAISGDRDQLRKRREGRFASLERYRQATPKFLADLNLFCLIRFIHLANPVFNELEPLLHENLFFEWMMQHDADKPWYRDHLVHPLRVTVLGDHLLTCPFNPSDGGLTSLDKSSSNDGQGTLGQGIADVLNGIINDTKTSNPASYSAVPAGPGTIRRLHQSLGASALPVDFQLVRQAWRLAALFHDTGYVFGFFAGLADKLQTIYAFDTPHPLQGLEGAFRSQAAEVLFHFLEDEALAYQKWLTKTGHKLKTDDFRPPDPTLLAASGMGPAFLVQLCRQGHAAPGALNLIYVVDNLLKRGDLTPRFRLAAGLAALAVLRHDTDDARVIVTDPADAQVIETEVKETRERIAKTRSDNGRANGWMVTRPVSFKDDPLSFLLVLCDQLQDWRRFKSSPDGCCGPHTFGRTSIVWDFDEIELVLDGGTLKVDAGPRGNKVDSSHYQKEKKRYFGPNGNGGWLDFQGFVQAMEFRVNGERFIPGPKSEA